MIFKIRVGFAEYEKLELSESQAADLVDFVLNGTRGYNPCGSLFINNQAIVGLIQSGKLLNEDSYDDYRRKLSLQK